ncbi:MAG: hypothetical protein WCJ30_24615, partial [Deltaproteobacteria bacterium]
MTAAVQRAEQLVPPGITRALSRVSTRMNAWIALDAALAGAAVGTALAAAVLASPWIGRTTTRWGLFAGLCAAIVVAARESRSRWVDAFGAASMLDRLLDAKDRFVSALHFAVATDSSPLHALQIEEAASFLDGFDHTPSPPRPSMRFPRFVLVAAVIALASLASPFVRTAFARWVGHHSAAAVAAHADDSPQAIAARAAALREALRDSPNRRIDAEINALDRALTEQTARAEAERAHAIERAAAALETAHAEDVAASQPGANNGSTRETPSAHADSPETQAARAALALAQSAREQSAASQAALQNELHRAEASLVAAQHTQDAAAEARVRAELDRLLTQLEQLQAQRDAASRQELAAQEALRDAQQRDTAALAQTEPGRRTADAERAAPTLDEAVRRLDRALQSIERTDHSAAVPSARTGQAIDQASLEVQAQLPETARSLEEASRARDANDGQRVDEAIERARQSLAREAHAEPDDIRRAREALEALHDQVAQNAQAQRQNGENGENSQQNQRGDQARNGSQSSIGREQEALRNAQNGEHGQNGQHGENGEHGDPSQNGQQGQQGQ